jgi:hypothetical protein
MRGRLKLVWLAYVLATGAVAFSTWRFPALSDEITLVAMYLVAAAMPLVGVWAVLGGTRPLVRVVGTALCAGLSILASGILAATRDELFIVTLISTAVILALTFLNVVVAAIVRWRGLRITSISPERNLPHAPPRLSLLDMFSIMTYFAVSTALVPWVSFTDPEGEGLWQMIGFFLAVALCILPVGWIGIAATWAVLLDGAPVRRIVLGALPVQMIAGQVTMMTSGDFASFGILACGLSCVYFLQIAALFVARSTGIRLVMTTRELAAAISVPAEMDRVQVAAA